ncbi:hypothetical protein ABW19_dt0206145 [Dactylella cylindrospora]|nr:hypothetical protein ABW19_dt0206145 [Dactylella cylindrospora]
MRSLIHLLLGLSCLVNAAPSRPSLSSTLKYLGLNETRFTSYSQRNHLSNPGLTCAVLEELFGRTVYSASEGGNYTALAQVNWSQTTWSRPACIVSPRHAQDVSKIITVLRILQTRFSVRSGGHMPNPGFSNAGPDSVLIELGSLKKLELNPNRSTVTIGVGNRWRTVYGYLQKYNLTVMGGRVGTVGVGGFVMGGGLNFFSGHYGLGCDTVVRFQIVLSDGRIVDATRRTHPELFRALKGGSANFGIVTEYEMRTLPSTPIYYEAIRYPSEQYEPLMHALVEYQNRLGADTKSSLVTSFRKTGNLVIFLYLEPTIRPPVFNPFLALNGTQFFPPTITTIFQLVEAVGVGFSSEPERDLTRVSSFEASEDVLSYAYEIFQQVLPTLPANSSIEYVPQPIPPSMVAIGNQNGGNVLGLSPRSQIWLDIVAKWKNPSDDAFLFNATKFILDKTEQFEGNTCHLSS